MTRLEAIKRFRLVGALSSDHVGCMLTPDYNELDSRGRNPLPYKHRFTVSVVRGLRSIYAQFHGNCYNGREKIDITHRQLLTYIRTNFPRR